MNFIEAYKTGRPFKRKSWHGWVTGVTRTSDIPCPLTLYWKDDSIHGTRHAIYAEELFAEDWEIKQEPREYWIRPSSGGVITLPADFNSVPVGYIRVREVPIDG